MSPFDIHPQLIDFLLKSFIEVEKLQLFVA